jgi:hypothetical protein
LGRIGYRSKNSFVVHNKKIELSPYSSDMPLGFSAFYCLTRGFWHLYFLKIAVPLAITFEIPTKIYNFNFVKER